MDRKGRLEQELKRLIDVIVKDYNPQRLILFGSMAQGRVHEWSDIDLAIVKETKSRFLDRISEVLDLADPHLALNVFVYTPQEVKDMERGDHYFWVDEIVGKGKVLYERAA
jgi:uncharacterized protein